MVLSISQTVINSHRKADAVVINDFTAIGWIENAMTPVVVRIGQALIRVMG
jgi:hypothetical protein